MKNKTKKKGFTFAEVLAVLTVMTIILFAALPQTGAYISSYNRKRAQYNHQTIVYSIREWSLQNDDHKAVPNSFTVKNSQGLSVADYIKEYNEEYYKEALERDVLAGRTIKEVQETNPQRTYTFDNGKLVTKVEIKKNKFADFEFDPLPGVYDRRKWLRE